MANALDDYDPDTPPPAPAPGAVVGAPEPGGKDDYSRVTPPGAAAAGPNALDDYDAGELPQASAPGSHPLFGEEPGAPYASGAVALGQNLVRRTPMIGEQLDEASNWFASGGDPLRRAEIEGAKAKTDTMHPNYALTGGILGEVGGLTAAVAALPEAFGAAETTKTAAAVMGATSNFLIKRIDDWMRGKEPNTTELALTAGGGAIGGALTVGLKRLFDATIQPGIEGLAKKAIADYKIPLPAGMVSANPLLAKLPGQLLSSGSGAKALNAWYTAIPRTIGSDAPRLTSKVLADANRLIAARVKQLPPDATIGDYPELVDRMRAVRILEKVLAKHPNGKFTPEEFEEGVQEGVDAIARNRAETYAYDGGGAVADLAKIGSTFLKGAPAPHFDWKIAVQLARQGITTMIPAAGHHLLQHGLSMPTLTTAGISAGLVGGARLLGKGIAAATGALAARSPKIANALIGQSTPLSLVPPAVGLAKPVLPGLIQQAVPVGTDYLGATPQRNYITRTRADLPPSARRE